MTVSLDVGVYWRTEIRAFTLPDYLTHRLTPSHQNYLHKVLPFLPSRKVTAGVGKKSCQFLCLFINWRIQDTPLQEQGTWHCKWYQAHLNGPSETLLAAKIRAQMCLTVHIHPVPLCTSCLDLSLERGSVFSIHWGWNLWLGRFRVSVVSPCCIRCGENMYSLSQNLKILIETQQDKEL